jgi:hypothetical protein
MTAAASREDWRAAAACTGANAALFFSSSPARAAAICGRCPVRAECLYDALDTDAPGGVWGGLTRQERDDLPTLADAPAAAIAALRDHLDQLDAPEVESAPTEGTSAMDGTIPTPRPAEPTLHPVPLPVGKLLAWAADHSDAKIRKLAVQARDAVDTLRARHHTEQQVKSIDEEAAALEARLAQLKEQKAAITPVKKPAAVTRDYEPADVRAWAATAGIDVPTHGRVPQTVVDSWRAAGAPTRKQ